MHGWIDWLIVAIRGSSVHDRPPQPSWLQPTSVFRSPFLVQR
jgi:hypothetical protein